jgi:hypothetical protein
VKDPAPLTRPDISLRGQRTLIERQAELLPHVDQRLGQVVDDPATVIGAGRDAQPFHPFGTVAF